MTEISYKAGMLIALIICAMFAGCISKPENSLEINPAVKQSNWNIFGLVILPMDKSYIQVEIKNNGAREQNFVKCDYNILSVENPNIKYTGTIDLVDKLAPGDSVSRDSKEINENLNNNNDGRNFILDLSCYSQELKTAGLVFKKTIEFT